VTVDAPPEPEGGQDDQPPALRLVIAVTIMLLRDLNQHLDPESMDTEAEAQDLRLRIKALLGVLRRFEDRLDEELD